MSKYFWSNWKRYPSVGMIGGVLAGMAHHFEWNPRLLRVIVVIVAIVWLVLPVAMAYGILWYLMEPEKGMPGSRTTSDSPKATPQALRARFMKMEGRLRNIEACVASNEYELRRELAKL